MKVDILINGVRHGTAEIKISIPEDLQRIHAIGESAVLEAAVGGDPTWYCMGKVTFAKRIE